MSVTRKNDFERLFDDHEIKAAAEERLVCFFASFGVDARVARDRLIDPFLAGAEALCQSRPGLDPAAVAQEEAAFKLAAWLDEVLELTERGVETPIMVGRAAFLACGGPARWPDMLLADKNDLASVFIEAFREAVPLDVPPGEPGVMPHQPYESWSIQDLALKALRLDRRMVQSFAEQIMRDWRSGRGLMGRDKRPAA